MTIIIEEVEVETPADAWQQLPPSPLKVDTLADLVDEFLAQGGTIEQIAIGMTADQMPGFNPGKFNTVNSKHTGIVRQRRESRTQKGDEKFVERLAPLLEDLAPEGARLYLIRELGVSSCKLRRLLEAYYPEHPVSRFILGWGNRLCSNERRQAMAEKVKQAQRAGHRSRAAIAGHAGMSLRTLNELIRLKLVDVPRIDRWGNPWKPAGSK